MSFSKVKTKASFFISFLTLNYRIDTVDCLWRTSKLLLKEHLKAHLVSPSSVSRPRIHSPMMPSQIVPFSNVAASSLLRREVKDENRHPTYGCIFIPLSHPSCKKWEKSPVSSARTVFKSRFIIFSRETVVNIIINIHKMAKRRSYFSRTKKMHVFSMIQDYSHQGLPSTPEFEHKRHSIFKDWLHLWLNIL